MPSAIASAQAHPSLCWWHVSSQRCLRPISRSLLTWHSGSRLDCKVSLSKHGNKNRSVNLLGVSPVWPSHLERSRIFCIFFRREVENIWNVLQEELVWAVSDPQASSLTMTKHSPQSHRDSFLFLNNLWYGSLSRRFWKVKEIMSTCLVTSSENSGWLGTLSPSENHWLSLLSNPWLLCNFQTWIYVSLHVFLSLCSGFVKAYKKRWRQHLWY